jgi:peptidoglycan/LPS O-acetylase OafA/YrhL
LQITPAHNNNFDFLRFLFASFVIFSHSYALMGDITKDPLFPVAGRVFSEIGVCGFFAISGYLIHQSLHRSSSLFSFIRKRLFRIVPGLFVAIVFTTLIIGPIVSTYSISAYFSDTTTWIYAVKNIFLIPGSQTLPGVFTDNPSPAVNGSLWTLRYEILLYALLSLLYFVPLSKKRIIIPLALTLLLSSLLLIRYELITLPKTIYYFIILGNYFLGGAFLSLFPDLLNKKKSMLLFVSAAIFLVSLFFFKKELEVFGILGFTVMVITFGLHYFPIINFSKYTGDVSYGTYIYAYPIQQALIVWLHPENVFMLMLPSFLLSWLAGWLSWHLVEQKFIRRKQLPIPG